MPTKSFHQKQNFKNNLDTKAQNQPREMQGQSAMCHVVGYFVIER